MINWINAKETPPPFGKEVLIFEYSDGSRGDKGFITYFPWRGNKAQLEANIARNKFIYWAYVNVPDVTGKNTQLVISRFELMDFE